MVLMGVGIDTYRAGDLGKDHGSAGGGDRYSGPGPGIQNHGWAAGDAEA